MSVDCFLDTNVIVYAAAGRGVESAKRERALDLIETREFGLSAQVLQEFYVTVVHKIEIPLAPSEALEWIEQLEAFPCLPIDSGLVKIAAELSLRHRISYWDGSDPRCHGVARRNGPLQRGPQPRSTLRTSQGPES